VAERIIADPGEDLGFLLPPEIVEPQPRLREGAARLYGRIIAGLLASDALAIEAAVLVSWAVGIEHVRSAGAAALLLGMAPAVMAAVFAAHGLYRPTNLTPADEFRRLISAVSVATVVLGLLLDFVSAPLLGSRGTFPLDASWLGLTWVTALLVVLGERKVWHRVVHRLRKSGALAFRTVIVGTNHEAQELALRLRNRGLGYDTLGMVVVYGEVSEAGALPVLGTLVDLPAIVRDARIECAFIASSAMRPEETTRVLQVMRRMHVEVRVSANMPEILASRLSVQAIGNTLALSLQTASLSGPQAFVKRVFDLAVAGTAIVLTSPLWLVASVLIRTTSKGPSLFRQKRVGRHGKLFTIYKFRTMIPNADRLVTTLSGRGNGQGPLFKIGDDPRLTRVGRFLRKWSIDELPQLLNVVRGDMSLVGPRPMPATFDQSYYEDWHLQRLEVLPGITGLWQISGRSDLTFDECVRLDLFYIENWSVTYDLFILIKTIPAVLFGRGAY
jgi:exopolysaccharide biosynthesis polyprenyl glycosylphosphotransferase